jgi:hypothetical protein
MVKLESFLVKGTEGVISEINKILSKALVKPAKVLNPFSSRFSFFFNFALLGSPDRIPIKLFNS